MYIYNIKLLFLFTPLDNTQRAQNVHGWFMSNAFYALSNLQDYITYF